MQSQKRLSLSLLVTAVVAISSMTLLAGESQARGKDWCTKSQNRGTDCSFDTLEQCRAAASGTGASCRQRRR